MVLREGWFGRSFDLSMDTFLKHFGGNRAARSFREPGLEKGCWEKEEGWRKERWDTPKGNSMPLPNGSKLDGSFSYNSLPHLIPAKPEAQ